MAVYKYRETVDSPWQTLSVGGNSAAGESVPTGSVFWLATATVPSGYLLCDGSAVLKADYPALYEVLGDTFGTSTDTAFYLPNLQAAFIRGTGTQDGYTAGALGAKQAATSITKGSGSRYPLYSVGSADKSTSAADVQTNSNDDYIDQKAVTYYMRPFNVALTPIIKC